MHQLLQQHIRQHTHGDSGEIDGLERYFQPLSIPKKHQLLDVNSLCDKHYFVAKGCLRMFFTDEKGVEQTIQFAIENWWMTDIDAFYNRRKSSFAIQSVESSELLVIDRQSFDNLLAAHPVMERYFRLIYQRAYAAALFRISYIFRLSKEEFYDMFSSHYPDFIQRVPQKILASFLGFTPEYLSELRRKKRS